MLIASQRCSQHHDLHNIHPVTGTLGNAMPTTGDVQLYPDPATCTSKVPILYADCEGLTGGSTLPKALQDDRWPGSGARLRPIAWAKSVKGGTHRQYMVSHVFPKLLYTFSDVVVFVTREARLVVPSNPYCLCVLVDFRSHETPERWNPVSLTFLFHGPKRPWTSR